MAKDVLNPEFWKARLEEAEASGQLRDSVYKTTDEYWTDITKVHRHILFKIIRPDQHVLDAGCGYGRGFTFFPGIYTGVDQSQEMIDKARILYPTYPFSCEKLEDLKFPDKSFDWVVCISVQAMILREVGYSAWTPIQNELLRVSKHGIVCLEYGDKDVEQASVFTMIGSPAS